MKDWESVSIIDVKRGEIPGPHLRELHLNHQGGPKP